MIDVRFVPIEKWPGEPRKNGRKVSAFRSSYARTLDLLEAELKALRAKNITIECYFSRENIRNDGWPRGKAQPSAPGVVLSFTSRAGHEMSFPCDTYRHWIDNLHAIALALEALRAVDRYGVTRNSEQYKGWARLPEAPREMGYIDATNFLFLHSQIPVQSADDLRRAYREASRRLHPDSSNGSHEQFVLLGKAVEAISLHNGWAA